MNRWHSGGRQPILTSVTIAGSKESPQNTPAQKTRKSNGSTLVRYSRNYISPRRGTIVTVESCHGRPHAVRQLHRPGHQRCRGCGWTEWRMDLGGTATQARPWRWRTGVRRRHHVRRRQRRCREVERVRCSADDGLERWFVVADLPSPGRGRVCCSHVLQHRQSCVWICCTALAFHFYTSGVCLSD